MPPSPGKATNALIVGYDTRKGAEADVGRSDTVMLLRADPNNDTISLLSFPRDLVVDHPGCRAHPTPWRDRINTAYTFCGPSGTAKTVRALTGLPINYVITVDFHGFKQIVDKVGGVYVDVDQRYYNADSAASTPDDQPAARVPEARRRRRARLRPLPSHGLRLPPHRPPAGSS